MKYPAIFLVSMQTDRGYEQNKENGCFFFSNWLPQEIRDSYVL